MFCCVWEFILFFFHLHFGISHLKAYSSRTKVGNFNPMSPRAQVLRKGKAQSWRTQMMCWKYRQFHTAVHFTKENAWYMLYIVHALFMLLCSITDCMELSQLCQGQEGSQLHNEFSSVTYFNPSPYSPAHPSPSSSVTETSIFYHVHQSRAL